MSSPDSSAGILCLAPLSTSRQLGPSRMNVTLFKVIVDFALLFQLSEGSTAITHEIVWRDASYCSRLDGFLYPDQSEPVARRLLSKLRLRRLLGAHRHLELVEHISSGTRRIAKGANPVGLERLRVVAKVKLVVTYQQKDWSRRLSLKKDGSKCAVCFEGFSLRKGATRMPCSHPFHRRCIVKWLTEESNSCPVCRFKI